MTDATCPMFCSDEALADRAMRDIDTFCAICGEWVNMSPDIFGCESGEGRVIDGRVLCASCIEQYGEAEGWA